MMEEHKFSVRIRRPHSNSSGRLGAISPLLQCPVKELCKRAHTAISEQAQLDGSNVRATTTFGLRHKRRAVLKDVTNMSCESNNLDCLHASEVQVQIFSYFKLSAASWSLNFKFMNVLIFQLKK